MHLSIFILTLGCIINFAQPANILGILPLPFYSHTNNFMPIFRELAARGHNVTLVSPFPEKKPVANLTQIITPRLEKELIASLPSGGILAMDNIHFRLIGLWKFGIAAVEAALQFDQMKHLITDEHSKFDLILVETWFFQEPFIAFGHKFNAPVINLMPTLLFPFGAHFTGNYLPVTYVPMIHFSYSDHMAFHERVVTTFFYVWEVLVGQLYFLRLQETTMRQHFIYPGSENLPPIADLLRNTSLTLVDYHPAVGYPMPLHNNVVSFGGTNIQGAEKLPENLVMNLEPAHESDMFKQDLQRYMDNAKNGVIYLSFGSYHNVNQLEPYMAQAIISGLGLVKQNVLMKLGDQTVLKQYNVDNIEARPWFPQTSVLAHPNCKLFITHGGLHGLMEGVFHAVPMLVIPLVADQHLNGKFIENSGIGEMVDLKSITASKLHQAINKMIDQPLYRENIKERSAIFKDNPMDIMDNVIYWIEYVIRHKGAPHLRPAVLDLQWYQYLMLDVIAFYLLIMFVIVYLIVKIIATIFNILKWICCRKKVKRDSKKSKEE